MQGLTTRKEVIIVPIISGCQVRCPMCGSLFMESLEGQAVVTCRNARHPLKEAIRIEFRTT